MANPASLTFPNTMLVINSVSQPYRTVFPTDSLTAVTAPGNGTMSFQYFPVSDAFTASRLDVLIGMSQASSATANTFGMGITAIAGLYSNVSSSLLALTTGSTNTSYSCASNSAGFTQLNQTAIRAVSCPLAISAYPGEYFVGFAWSTNTISSGTATTALGQTFSIYGGNALQSALNFAIEFTNATATSAGLYAGMGIHSVSQSYPAASYAVSDINGTGANLSAANIALVFRNQ